MFAEDAITQDDAGVDAKVTLRQVVFLSSVYRRFLLLCFRHERKIENARGLEEE